MHRGIQVTSVTSFLTCNAISLNSSTYWLDKGIIRGGNVSTNGRSPPYAFETLQEEM